MNYRTAAKALAAVPATVLAVGLLAAPAQAVSTPTTVHFYGHCRSFSVLYTTTETTHVKVESFRQYGNWIYPIRVLASGKLLPDTTGGFIGGFRRDGVAKMVTVEIDGGIAAGGVTRQHTFWCGSRS
jgi:hypothetical protein